MAFLVDEANDSNRQYAIAEGLRIGRSKGCGVVFEHPEVSREHAVVAKRGDDYVVEDLHSRHGTFVNGRRVEEPETLRDGDVITVRGFRLRFRLDEGEEGPTAVGLPTVSAEDLSESAPVIMSTLDVARTEALAEVRPEAKLRALLEISRSVQSTLSIDELLPQVLDGILRIFAQAQQGFVVMRDGDSEDFVPKAWRSRSGSSQVGRVSYTVVRRALERREAILSRDTALDANLSGSESISDLGIRSILCAPLLGKTKQPLGVLQVHSSDRGRRFTADDLEVLVNVAGIMSMAIENARLHEEEMEGARIRRETELAWDVQRRFLPARTPTIRGYDFFHFYDAARSVGGDYAGFTNLPGGRVGVALGDVSGKGIPAAMMMARLSSDVRYALLMAPDPGSALTLVNQSLAEAEIEGKFVTLTVMVLEPDSSRLTVANAGHPFPILRRGDGELVELGTETAGLPLNVSLDPNVRYENFEFELEVGSSVVIYSDGISEARDTNGDDFGLERLFASCREGGSASVMGARVVAALTDFVAGAPQHDDTSLICLGREC